MKALPSNGLRPGAEAYLQWREVVKRFGDKTVLDGFSLDVARGEILYLMGTSGVGKSVSIRMLVGLLKPTLGEVWFGGGRLDTLSEQDFIAVRKKIAMVLQGSGLLESLTLAENLALPLSRHFSLSNEKAVAEALTHLQGAGLGDFEHRLPSEVSDGIRKRASIARAFSLRPEVVLLDEPTTSLDPPSARGVDDLLRKLAKETGLTALVVSHDLVSARTVAHRIALLYGRKVHTTFAPSSIDTHPDPIVRQFFFGEVDGPMETPGF